MTDDYELDEDNFDAKVASIIVKIHGTNKRKLNHIKYNDWVNENREHLNNLYELSGVNCELDEFYSYVYDHSSN